MGVELSVVLLLLLLACLTSFSLSKGTVLLKTGVMRTPRASRKETGTGVKLHSLHYYC